MLLRRIFSPHFFFSFVKPIANEIANDIRKANSVRELLSIYEKNPSLSLHSISVLLKRIQLLKEPLHEYRAFMSKCTQQLYEGFVKSEFNRPSNVIVLVSIVGETHSLITSEQTEVIFAHLKAIFPRLSFYEKSVVLKYGVRSKISFTSIQKHLEDMSALRETALERQSKVSASNILQYLCALLQLPDYSPSKEYVRRAVQRISEGMLTMEPMFMTIFIKLCVKNNLKSSEEVQKDIMAACSYNMSTIKSLSDNRAIQRRYAYLFEIIVIYRQLRHLNHKQSDSTIRDLAALKEMLEMAVAHLRVNFQVYKDHSLQSQVVELSAEEKEIQDYMQSLLGQPEQISYYLNNYNLYYATDLLKCMLAIDYFDHELILAFQNTFFKLFASTKPTIINKFLLQRKIVYNQIKQSILNEVDDPQKHNRMLKLKKEQLCFSLKVLELLERNSGLCYAEQMIDIIKHSSAGIRSKRVKRGAERLLKPLVDGQSNPSLEEAYCKLLDSL